VGLGANRTLTVDNVSVWRIVLDIGGWNNSNVRNRTPVSKMPIADRYGGRYLDDNEDDEHSNHRRRGHRDHDSLHLREQGITPRSVRNYGRTRTWKGTFFRTLRVCTLPPASSPIQSACPICLRPSAGHRRNSRELLQTRKAEYAGRSTMSLIPARLWIFPNTPRPRVVPEVR